MRAVLVLASEYPHSSESLLGSSFLVARHIMAHFDWSISEVKPGFNQSGAGRGNRITANQKAGITSLTGKKNQT